MFAFIFCLAFMVVSQSVCVLYEGTAVPVSMSERVGSCMYSNCVTFCSPVIVFPPAHFQIDEIGLSSSVLMRFKVN